MPMTITRSTTWPIVSGLLPSTDANDGILLEELSHQRFDVIEIERLGDKGIGRTIVDRIRRQTGNDHDDCIRRRRTSFDSTAQLVAPELGHHDVRQHQAWSMFRHGDEGLLAIVDHNNLQPDVFEHHGEHVGDMELVVCDDRGEWRILWRRLVASLAHR